MTDVHQIVAYLALAAVAALLAAAVWSLVVGRRSGGALDHRFAVDRLILGAGALLAVNGLVGILLLVGGSRPADPLHLLYGPVALITPALGWWLGGRPGDGGLRPATRVRRDAWLVAAGVVLLGVSLRLFATG